MKMLRWLVLVVMLGAAGAVHGQEVAEWTIIHYLAVDNNLEGQGFGDLREMSYAGSDANINIVVQYDRAEGYDSSGGDWTTTRRFYVQNAPRVTLDSRQRAEQLAALLDDGTVPVQQIVDEILALETQDPQTYARVMAFYNVSTEAPFDQPALEDIGEANMGDAAVLEEFISWAIENYPARRYAVIISSHGGGWHAIGPDEGNNGDMLELPEIDAALASVRARYNIDRFDIVGFDACLMSTVEVAAAIAPHAHYMLASQEVVPGQGWDYAGALGALKANPTMDAFELGSAFVDAYMEYYAGPGNRTKVDIALIELTQIAPLQEALGRFAQAAKQNTLDALSAYATARLNAQTFGVSAGDRGEYFSAIDLRDFMTQVSNHPAITGDIFSASQEVVAAVDRAVAYQRSDSRLPQARGLSLYLPLNSAIYESANKASRYDEVIAPPLRVWDDFLRHFHDVTNTSVTGEDLAVRIQEVFHARPVASVEDMPTVLFVGSGRGVVDMSYFVTYQPENAPPLLVDAANIAIFTTLPSGDVVKEYPEGDTNTIFSWGAEVPLLTDGVNQALVVVFTDNTSSNEGLVEGMLTTPDGDIQANLVMDLDTRTLRSIIALQPGDEGYAAPFEVSPQPGWQFTPSGYVINDSGELETTLSSTTFTFGDTPLSFFYAPAPSGQYVFTLVITDLAGNQAVERVGLTVDNSGVSGEWRGFTDTNYGINFPYPYTWYDSSTLVNEDGSETYILADRDRNSANKIYVDVYQASDADEVMAVLEQRFGDLGIALGEMAPVAGEQVSGYLAPYGYIADDGEHQGYVFALYSPVSGYGYIIDVDFMAEYIDEMERVTTRIYENLLFFEPRLFD
jgi:hypothetical protein